MIKSYNCHCLELLPPKKATLLSLFFILLIGLNIDPIQGFVKLKI